MSLATRLAADRLRQHLDRANKRADERLAAMTAAKNKALGALEELTNIVLDEYKGRTLPLKRTTELVEKMRVLIAELEEVKT